MYGRDAGGNGKSLLSNDGHLPAKIVPFKPTKTQPRIFPFLELPAEIRNMIYSYVMIPRYPDYVYVPRVKSDVTEGLQYANRQIYEEASTVYYNNVRGILFNECHFVTRASCREIFLKGLSPSMHAYPEHPFLPFPQSNRHEFYEERHYSDFWAYRPPRLQYIQPCELARMAEIEISLAWLPPYSDYMHKLIESIMDDVAVMLHCILDLLRQTGDQKGKKIILTFGSLL